MDLGSDSDFNKSFADQQDSNAYSKAFLSLSSYNKNVSLDLSYDII